MKAGKNINAKIYTRFVGSKFQGANKLGLY